MIPCALDGPETQTGWLTAAPVGIDAPEAVVQRHNLGLADVSEVGLVADAVGGRDDVGVDREEVAYPGASEQRRDLRSECSSAYNADALGVERRELRLTRPTFSVLS